MRLDDVKQRVAGATREAATFDLRLSYLIIAGLVAAGGIVNLFLASGWTVWPLVFVAGLLVMVDEAASRNGVGIPMLRVYAFALGVMVLWLAAAMFMRTIHPVVLLLALAIAGYYGGRGYMRVRANRALMEERVGEGLCAHCGEPAVDGVIECQSCGEVANPDGIRSRWSTLQPRNAADVARTRTALRPPSNVEVARQKEQALLAKRYRPQATKRR